MPHTAFFFFLHRRPLLHATHWHPQSFASMSNSSPSPSSPFSHFNCVCLAAGFCLFIVSRWQTQTSFERLSSSQRDFYCLGSSAYPVSSSRALWWALYTKQLETTVTTSLGQEKKTESSSLIFPRALPRLNIATGESAVEDNPPPPFTVDNYLNWLQGRRECA